MLLTTSACLLLYTSCSSPEASVWPVSKCFPRSRDLFIGGWKYSTGTTLNQDCGSFSLNAGDVPERFLKMVLWLKSATSLLFANSLILSSSLPWLTLVTTSTSAWIPITPATPSPTVASASRSTGTGKSTTCTWGRRVGNVCLRLPLLFLLLLSNDHLSIYRGPSPLHPGDLFSGINTLINIMSRLGQDDPSPSR